MEWIGLILLYMISGFMKKRQQNLKRREIESDPDWENGTEVPTQEPSTKFDNVLKSIFDQENPFDFDSSPQKNFDEFEEYPDDELEELDIVDEPLENTDDAEIAIIEKQEKQFEENIYHSKLAERSEQHFGNKWKNKIHLRKKLFDSRKTLKKGIVIKEILDKPISLR